jgi:hypothetical protein
VTLILIFKFEILNANYCERQILGAPKNENWPFLAYSVPLAIHLEIREF